MRTDDLDFHLPPERIAQVPPAHRSDSRLLHYHRPTQTISHRTFSDLPTLLRPGDLLVFNDARVIPARFALRKPTGGRIEGLFLSQTETGQWIVLLRNLGDPAPHARLHFESAETIQATVLSHRGGGEYELSISDPRPALEILSELGRMPLPPYIHREKQKDSRDELDRNRYQTIYANSPGAVAAPTAGLHFTPELMQQLEARGIDRAMVTLEVGVGTFRPVTADDLQNHTMHSERYHISPAAAEKLNRAKKEKRRIIPIGTTSARVLESQPPDEDFRPRTAETSIFIYPPYKWKHISALLTNFHLPRSTLIALVAAMTGLQEQRRVYQEAIEAGYRFFSYGDAMFVE